MNTDILLLQAGGGGYTQLLFLGAMILIFYMFLIRPQAKKQKEQKSFMDGLNQNDQVVTASGILGRISKIEDDIVTLEVASKSYIRVTKNAISKEMTDAIYGADKAAAK